MVPRCDGVAALNVAFATLGTPKAPVELLFCWSGTCSLPVETFISAGENDGVHLCLSHECGE